VGDPAHEQHEFQLLTLDRPGREQNRNYDVSKPLAPRTGSRLAHEAKGVAAGVRSAAARFGFHKAEPVNSTYRELVCEKRTHLLGFTNSSTTIPPSTKSVVKSADAFCVSQTEGYKIRLSQIGL
jgi:hypothetical protein